MDTYELLGWCFMHFYGADVSNAAIHTAHPRWSPITFRLAEEILAQSNSRGEPYAADVQRVLDDRGAYPEDRGR